MKSNPQLANSSIIKMYVQAVEDLDFLSLKSIMNRLGFEKIYFPHIGIDLRFDLS